MDTTEQLHFHFSLSCIGEGNDNPLQCSCLENPRDKGAWWEAIYGVAQSWTRLKQLSSSSSKRPAGKWESLAVNESEGFPWVRWEDVGIERLKAGLLEVGHLDQSKFDA